MAVKRVVDTLIFENVISGVVSFNIVSRMLLIAGTGNGERGTANWSLGTSVQR